MIKLACFRVKKRILEASGKKKQVTQKMENQADLKCHGDSQSQEAVIKCF